MTEHISSKQCGSSHLSYVRLLVEFSKYMLSAYHFQVSQKNECLFIHHKVMNERQYLVSSHL